MTQAAAPTPVLRLPLPQDRLVYSGLPTDFYPWTEALAELEHLDSTFTAVLDVQEDERWARFVWVRGQLLGGVGAAGRDVTLAVAMRALPHAELSLTRVEPLVSDILWTCRTAAPKALELVWPAAYDLLDREHFRGALLSGQTCSFWEGGRVVTGSLPQSGMRCLVLSPGANLERTALIEFWQEMIAVTHRNHPQLDEIWRQVSVQLSSQYPSLDPFAQEISVARGQLLVEDNLSMIETRSALLAAFHATLARLNTRLADLPVSHLRQRAVWSAAGLEAK